MRTHRFIIAEQLREIGVEAAGLLLEPIGRTHRAGRCCCRLADRRARPGGVRAGHAVGSRDRRSPGISGGGGGAPPRPRKPGCSSPSAFTPDRAETGYGYIAAGTPIAACDGAFAVARFVEKPQQPDAERYVAAGDYFWNSGIFLFPAVAYLAELERLRPDMLAACKEAFAKAKSDADFIRLDKAAFAACPADSIDYAVMEHTGAAAIVPVSMGWSDPRLLGRAVGDERKG